MAERYRALGGDITLIAKPGVKHHPHGLEDSTPIVEFILKHTKRGAVSPALLSDFDGAAPKLVDESAFPDVESKRVHSRFHLLRRTNADADSTGNF